MNNFWQTKSLQELSKDEWESLCDHCGKCCTIRLEDIDSGLLFSTSVVCKYFDQTSGLCQCYAERSRLVPDCITMNPDVLKDIDWLPSTCAYGLIRDNKPLPSWHPLVTGVKDSAISSGNGIQGRVVSEDDIHPDDLENFILDQNW